MLGSAILLTGSYQPWIHLEGSIQGCAYNPENHALNFLTGDTKVSINGSHCSAFNAEFYFLRWKALQLPNHKSIFFNISSAVLTLDATVQVF